MDKERTTPRNYIFLCYIILSACGAIALYYDLHMSWDASSHFFRLYQNIEIPLTPMRLIDYIFMLPVLIYSKLSNVPDVKTAKFFFGITYCFVPFYLFASLKHISYSKKVFPLAAVLMLMPIALFQFHPLAHHTIAIGLSWVFAVLLYQFEENNNRKTLIKLLALGVVIFFTHPVSGIIFSIFGSMHLFIYLKSGKKNHLYVSITLLIISMIRFIIMLSIHTEKEQIQLGSLSDVILTPPVDTTYLFFSFPLIFLFSLIFELKSKKKIALLSSLVLLIILISNIDKPGFIHEGMTRRFLQFILCIPFWIIFYYYCYNKKYQKRSSVVSLRFLLVNICILGFIISYMAHWRHNEFDRVLTYYKKKDIVCVTSNDILENPNIKGGTFWDFWTVFYEIIFFQNTFKPSFVIIPLANYPTASCRSFIDKENDSFHSVVMLEGQQPSTSIIDFSQIIDSKNAD